MKEINLELGMGVDVHGHNYSKAAVRAISDAIRHSSLTLFQHYSDPRKMKLEVFIGVQKPDQVDVDEVAKALPYGSVEVIVKQGGLDDDGMGGMEDIVIAVAAVKVWLDTSNHPYQLT